MESYLDNNLFDDLIEIGRIFKNINFEGTEIFQQRLNELYENLKLRETDSKGNYSLSI